MKMRRNNERGATLAEFAIVVLLLFTLIMGILEFGRAYNIFQTATNAAREGARYSVAPYESTSTLPTNAEVSAKVQEFLGSAGITNASISVDQTLAGTVNGIPIVYTSVAVTAPYQFLFFPFGTINLSTQVVMRNETN